MRRTIFLALLAALLFAPSARAAGPIQILRDCSDDGVLQGNYSASELREAKSELPTDIDEYSDCRDVLSRAISAKASTANDNDGGGTSNDGGAGAGGDSSGGSSDPSTPTSPDPGAEKPPVATDPGIETGPVTPQDWAAVNAAATEGDIPVNVKGRDVSPLLVADVGRNGLPGTLVVALALLGGAVLAALVLPLRRRVRGNRA